MPHCLIDIANLRAGNNTIKTESSIRKCISQTEENSATQTWFIYSDAPGYSGIAIALLSASVNNLLPTWQGKI